MLLLARWVLNCLINGEDGACSLCCCRQHIKTHDLRLPHKFLEEVVNAAFKDVDSLPEAILFILHMDLSQFVQNVCGVHARVVSELSWDHLEGLSEAADDHLRLATDLTNVVTQEA